MGEGRSQPQRLVSGFAAVDFAFIVRVVLSLLVVFIAYNAVAEEKASGTLKLTLANRVPRDQLLLGKFLGGWFVIMGSLAVSALVSLIIVLSHSFIAFAAGEWTRLLAFIGLSAVYLTVFYAVSLFVSVLVDRPSISLMILLQAWVFLIVIYPNLGVIAAENLTRLPSQEQLAQQKNAAFQPYAAEQKKTQEAFIQAVRTGGGISKELGVRNVEIWAKRAELDHQVDEEYGRKLTAQTNLARAISPSRRPSSSTRPPSGSAARGWPSTSASCGRSTAAGSRTSSGRSSCIRTAKLTRRRRPSISASRSNQPPRPSPRPGSTGSSSLSSGWPFLPWPIRPS